MCEVDMKTKEKSQIFKVKKTSTFTVSAPYTKPVKSVSVAVAEYKEIKAKLNFLQEQLKAPAEVIRLAAEAAPDGKIVTPEYKILLTEINSDRFDLKKAMEILGRDKLEPFLSTSTYTQLRVS